MRAGTPQILEPIMSTEVTVPSEYQGAAVAQIAQRKARSAPRPTPPHPPLHTHTHAPAPQHSMRPCLTVHPSLLCTAISLALTLALALTLTLTQSTGLNPNSHPDHWP